MMDKRHLIHGKFQSLLEISRLLEKTPRKFGTDQELSHGEIHMIEIIGDNEGLSVTEIGALIGVTKGAVSQSLKRLEKKGLAVKNTDLANLSRLLVSLTAKGKAAYWAHKHWHETMDGGFGSYLASLGDRDVAVVVDFLTRVEDFLLRRVRSKE
jgi:DNA-binding MarR family transcriptional regulator